MESEEEKREEAIEDREDLAQALVPDPEPPPPPLQRPLDGDTDSIVVIAAHGASISPLRRSFW
jgi:hypothetical protein